MKTETCRLALAVNLGGDAKFGARDDSIVRFSTAGSIGTDQLSDDFPTGRDTFARARHARSEKRKKLVIYVFSYLYSLFTGNNPRLLARREY